MIQERAKDDLIREIEEKARIHESRQGGFTGTEVATILRGIVAKIRLLYDPPVRDKVVGFSGEKKVGKEKWTFSDGRLMP